LVGEATADSFAGFAGETVTRNHVSRFLGFGSSRFANDVQMLDVPLAPHTNP